MRSWSNIKTTLDQCLSFAEKPLLAENIAALGDFFHNNRIAVSTCLSRLFVSGGLKHSEWTNVVLMLGHRLRHWPNSKTTLMLIFADYIIIIVAVQLKSLFIDCLFSVVVVIIKIACY